MSGAAGCNACAHILASMAEYAIRAGGRTALLTAHMAALSGKHRRNSRKAIAESLSAGVPRLEIDVRSLAGDDYIVTHDHHLQDATTGHGAASAATPDDVRACVFRDDPSDRPALLSEVVAMADGTSTQIQLDLKDWRPMAPDRVRTLLDVITPMAERIIVSTGQDWNLERLHRAAPALALGFDPGHYIDYVEESSPFFLPRVLGAYGYRDDHPLAVGRVEATPDYLRERMSMLTLQAPWAREFFLNYRMMLQMLDDGFNVAAWLHERGIETTAWTPDWEGEASLRDVRRLVEAGTARVTTNTIPAWLVAFGRGAER